MPSPVGHALGGIAAGSLISPRPDRRKLALFATVGVLADIDFILPIVHRGPTHSLAAAALAFGAALAVLRWERRPAMSGRLALAIGAAYLTHILFDWLGEDSGPPSGIMALWPFSSDYFVSGLDLFATVERRYWLPGFWRDNAMAVLREIAILTPVTWVALLAARSRRD
jgi:inner membrane protein